MGVTLREKKLSKGKTKFYLDIIQDGVRRYKFLDVIIHPSDNRTIKKNKKEIVKAIKSQTELEIASKGIEYIPSHKKKIDFIKYLDNFLGRYDKKDSRMISATINKFNAFVGDKKLYSSQIDRALIEAYRDYLSSPESNLKGESPHNYFTRFKKILKYAYNESILPNNPGVEVFFRSNTKKHTVKKEVLNAEEIRLLFNTYCGNEEVKRAFLLSCFTGLGIAEIRQLSWRHVKGNKLKIHRAKTGLLIEQDLGESALMLIGKKEGGKEYVFQITISDTAINKNLDRWMKKAKIDKRITFYCGRHTFATQLLINGTNLKTVSDLLGHSDIKHTVKYLNYLEEDKKNAIGKLLKL